MAELGTKYKCYKCGCKFYDLNKPEALCPQCGEDQANEETKKLLKKKRRRNMPQGKAEVKPMAEAAVDSSTDKDEDSDDYILDMEDIVLDEEE